MSRIRRAIGVGLSCVLVLSVFTFFLVFQIQLWHWYRYTIQLPKNVHNVITWGHLVRHNKQGFREKDFDARLLNQTDHLRVVILGDSITWGVGLGEPQRYSNILEALLQAQYPQKKITVLNFGVLGASTCSQRDILQTMYKDIKPNLIIIGFCFNDTQEKYQKKDYYFNKIMPFLNFLSWCKMTGPRHVIMKVYEYALISTKRMSKWRDAIDTTYNQDSIEWFRFNKALTDIFAMSQEVTTVPPLFISLNMGTSDRVPTDYNNPDAELTRYLRWYHRAESAAKKTGFISINCETDFREKLKNHVMAVMYGEDAHPDKVMNEIYAQKLFSVINEYRLLGEK